MKLETMDTRALLTLMQKINSEIERKRAKLESDLRELQKVDLREPVVKRGRGSHLKGTKVAPKYRGPKGETWAGRGAVPKWMRAAMKATGKKREAFLIH